MTYLPFIVGALCVAFYLGAAVMFGVIAAGEEIRRLDIKGFPFWVIVTSTIWTGFIAFCIMPLGILAWADSVFKREDFFV